MTTSVPMRLHITPLNPDLLPIVLGPVLAKSAENISYQTIETFPENHYGFVDLPEQDAKKLIAKLNGAILKGKKMKIEEARTKKRSRDAGAVDDEPKIEDVRKRSKKEKKGENILEGHELPAGRKVKRGWTEPKAEKSSNSKVSPKEKKKKTSKSQAPSKYSEKEELLFRTRLPPNKEDLSTQKKDKKSKKKTTSDTVIHEFERTEQQPSFLRDTTSAGRASEYVENVGWVDESGDLVEKEPSNLKRRRPTKAEGLMISVPSPSRAQKASLLKLQSPTQPVAAMSSDSDSSATSNVAEQEEAPDDDTSSSGITSSSAYATGSEQELDTTSGDEHAKHPLQPPQIEVQPAPETPHKVHPLEALFKKPNPPIDHEVTKPSLEIETSFSFFGEAPEEDDELPPMPNTPFTSRDINSRGVRSAAPTPDTAHPSRFASFASALAAHTEDHSDDEDLDDADGANDLGRPAQQTEERNESDFEKRFWAERGPNNRAWKASKRTALKEQRQKQNRLRRPRNR